MPRFRTVWPCRVSVGRCCCVVLSASLRWLVRVRIAVDRCRLPHSIRRPSLCLSRGTALRRLPLPAAPVAAARMAAGLCGERTSSWNCDSVISDAAAMPSAASVKLTRRVCRVAADDSLARLVCRVRLCALLRRAGEQWQRRRDHEGNSEATRGDDNTQRGRRGPRACLRCATTPRQRRSPQSLANAHTEQVATESSFATAL